MRVRLRLKVRVGSGLERASLCWLLATPSSARREGGWHRANSGIGKASTMIDAIRRAERRSYLVRVRVAVRAWVRVRVRDRVRVWVRRAAWPRASCCASMSSLANSACFV